MSKGGSIRPSRGGDDGAQLLGIIGDEVRSGDTESKRVREREKHTHTHRRKERI